MKKQKEHRAMIDALRAGWIARTGTAPDDEVLAALIEAEIDDEILLREARKRGFESGDPVVRARLARSSASALNESEASTQTTTRSNSQPRTETPSVSAPT